MTNNIIKVRRTGKSKWGWYLMLEDDSFKGCSEDVSNFTKSQMPCEIEITGTEGEGKQLKITRVKVLGNQPQQNQTVQQDMNEFENPVKVEKPGIAPAANYKPSPNFYETQNKTQMSIVAQSSIKAALEMINLHNQISDTKIEPDRNNLLNNAKIARLVYEDLMKGGEPKELPDY